MASNSLKKLGGREREQGGWGGGGGLPLAEALQCIRYPILRKSAKKNKQGHYPGKSQIELTS